MSDFPTLTSPDLALLFEAIRSRLERADHTRRGRITVPEGTSWRGRSILASLVGGPVKRTVDLAALEGKLTELGVGADLPAALAMLGYPVSEEPARRRAERREAADARQVARDEIASWDESWAAEWIEGVVGRGILAGIDRAGAVRLLRDVRELMARIEAAAGRADRLSRVDLAAKILGDSHALDWGTKHSAALARALSIRYGGDDREAWERAGVNLDRVSAPVLTWGLSVGGGLAGIVGAALDTGVPIHLSQLALRRHPVSVERGRDILVTENPRMVEAACERRAPYAVIALNGNPSAAARLLIDQLLRGGASLRYHGDFDAPGIGICARMYRLGLTPWRMDSEAYLAALVDADADGTSLRVDSQSSPSTPWDPPLQQAFNHHRLVVHEERLIRSLLG